MTELGRDDGGQTGGSPLRTLLNALSCPGGVIEALHSKRRRIFSLKSLVFFFQHLSDLLGEFGDHDRFLDESLAAPVHNIHGLTIDTVTA